jgi:hypothetical protein
MKKQIFLLVLGMIVHLSLFSQGFGVDSLLFRNGNNIRTHNVIYGNGYLVSGYPLCVLNGTNFFMLSQESAGPAWIATNSDSIHLGREDLDSKDKIMSTVIAGEYTCGNFNDTGYVSNFSVDSTGTLKSNVIIAFQMNALEMNALEMNAMRVSVGYISPTDTVVNFTVDSMGNVYARRVKVTQSDFPDYVFEEGYQLMSLSETEAYIRENGHLPGVPSAKEVEEEGLDIGEMNAILLKKIEEMTLLMIEQQKQIEQLKQEMETREKTR